MKKLKVTASWYVDMTDEDEKRYLENVDEINSNVAEFLENELETGHKIDVHSKIISE